MEELVVNVIKEAGKPISFPEVVYSVRAIRFNKVDYDAIHKAFFDLAGARFTLDDKIRATI